MSYALSWDIVGLQPSVGLPSWIPTSPDNWSFEVDIETSNNITSDQFVLGNETTSGRVWKLYVNNGNIGILHDSQWTVSGFIQASVSANTRYKVRGEFDGSDIRLYFDNILVDSAAGRNLTIRQGVTHLAVMGARIFGANTNGLSDGTKIYSAKFYDDAAQVTLSRDYTKEVLVGGDDTEYTEQANSQHGTLVNFPTDNSQWVFYAAGGAITADVAYTIIAPTFTGSASVTLPTPIANGAFSIASPSFSASADASLPQPIANADFTLNAPTFSASATATIPGFSASVAFTVNAPTFAADATATLPSPTADVDYTVTAPTFSVDITVTLPQPTANAAFSLPAPTFAASATATETGFNASVNFALLAPTFSADATATLPQPIADANFNITAPTFSVVAIAGGIAIIVDNETNINMPALSTNINAPVLSNNVRI